MGPHGEKSRRNGTRGMTEAGTMENWKEREESDAGQPKAVGKREASCSIYISPSLSPTTNIISLNLSFLHNPCLFFCGPVSRSHLLLTRQHQSPPLSTEHRQIWWFRDDMMREIFLLGCLLDFNDLPFWTLPCLVCLFLAFAMVSRIFLSTQALTI